MILTTKTLQCCCPHRIILHATQDIRLRLIDTLIRPKDKIIHNKFNKFGLDKVFRKSRPNSTT